MSSDDIPIDAVACESHQWEETYYGWKCACGDFVAFGCEPWMIEIDTVHERKP